ncbi:MAG: TetR/AcrR family transcriptional regulator, partial [Dehalococcoidia bacterium]|nr:TetR/AcrR family transcriptional regulator [Dehalococcoidia bacterium]
MEDRPSHREAPIRERILAAARDLFLREGFEGVSVRRIAERAGCSPGMLYHFFSSKELLLARLMEGTLEKLDQRLARYASAGCDPLRRLQQTLHVYVEFGFEHPHEYLFLFIHRHSQLAPDVLRVFETLGIACFRRIRALCEEILARGLLRTELGDPDEIAQALWAS